MTQGGGRISQSAKRERGETRLHNRESFTMKVFQWTARSSDNDVGLVTTSSDKFKMKPLVDDDDDDCDGKSVGSADTDSDLDDPDDNNHSGSDSTVYRDSGELCLLAHEQGQPPAGMEAYGHDFTDLSEEDQRQSRLKAIGDYNKYNAWEACGLTNEAMCALQKRDKSVVAPARNEWTKKK